MPTYNHARFVSEAVESVLAQTFRAWELVIVDDGPGHATLDILGRYRDPRIRVIARKHQGLSGLGAAYRTILEQSTAPLVALLDGDDRWPIDKLERQVADFDDPGVVLSHGAGLLIDECGCEYGRVTPFGPDVGANRPVGAIIPSLLSVNSILSPTVLVRRATLDAVGGFWQPEGVPYVDHPTWLLLAMEGVFAYHDAVVGSWRRHPAQWTTQIALADPSASPETAYVSVIANRFQEAASHRALPARPVDELLRLHVDRAATNRWRLALLAGRRREVARVAIELIRSGRPRLIGVALLGLAMWGIGSDLEWIQLRRDRVAWPSRRHRHVRPCDDAASKPPAH